MKPAAFPSRTRFFRTRFSRILLALCAALSCIALTCVPLAAQTPAPAPNVPALFLSDIHLDPFIDPTKAVALNAAPAADWSRILSGPSGPALTAARQTAFKACDDGPDTSNALWQSTLAELKKTAGPAAPQPARFAVISGDLLAHKFDCKYKSLVPTATAASYLDFTSKTVDYILSTLRTVLPGTPIYTALGNNDSGCTDYALDATHDAFLARLAPFVSTTARLAPADRAAALRDFAAMGSYSVPLAPLQHTRLIVLDDLYSSAKYVTCSGAADPAPAATELAWLQAQLDSARAAHDRVWVVGHIPPGVDLYSTAKKLTNVCAGGKPQMFLSSESLAQTLAANADIIHLAIFGHTHDDEMRLLTPSDLAPPPDAAPSSAAQGPSAQQPSGVPLKIVSSITPQHGNRPAFTLARVNTASATLVDYTVVMASDPAVSPIAWKPEYTFSTTYGQPAFDATSLTTLIADFQADPTSNSPMTKAYISAYFPSGAQAATGNSQIISAAWRPYACSLNHDSAAAFTACACAASK